MDGRATLAATLTEIFAHHEIAADVGTVREERRLAADIVLVIDDGRCGAPLRPESGSGHDMQHTSRCSRRAMPISATPLLIRSSMPPDLLRRGPVAVILSDGPWAGPAP